MAEETKKKAGRPKKVVTENIENTNNNIDEQLKQEQEKNKLMEQQLKDMQLMMLEMQKKMESMSTVNTPAQQIIVQQEANKDATRMVKVTCMIGNTYWLSTEAYGGGKQYRFEGYGDTKNIKFTDMISILEIYSKQFEQGMAILGSKKDYDDLQLEYVYNDVLTKPQMDNVINLVTDSDVDIVINMSDEMQEKVLSMIADKVISGFGYDFNRIKKLEDHTNLEEIISSFKMGRDSEEDE